MGALYIFPFLEIWGEWWGWVGTAGTYLAPLELLSLTFYKKQIHYNWSSNLRFFASSFTLK